MASSSLLWPWSPALMFFSALGYSLVPVLTHVAASLGRPRWQQSPAPGSYFTPASFLWIPVAHRRDTVPTLNSQLWELCTSLLYCASSSLIEGPVLCLFRVSCSCLETSDCVWKDGLAQILHKFRNIWAKEKKAIITSYSDGVTTRRRKERVTVS